MKLNMKQSEYLRFASFNKFPPVIPEVNYKLDFVLSKVAGNLATIAGAMRGGEYVHLKEIMVAVNDFRRVITGVKK